MDSNGTRYHLFSLRGDWARCREEGSAQTLGELWPESGTSAAAGVAWDGERNELTLRRKLFRFDERDAPGLPLSGRRGGAVDRFGNWFWIADDRRSVRVGSSGSGTTSVFWEPGLGSAPAPAQRYGEFGPADPAAAAALPGPVTLGGVAVTEDHYLAVGLVEPAGLLVFDLHTGGPPRRLVWPESVPFRPFDLSSRRRGGVFVLDADNRRLWELDRHFLVVSIGPATAAAETEGVFRPVTPTPPHPRAVSAKPVELDDAAVLEGEPISVAAARDGTVLVLDRNPAGPRSLLRRYRGGAVVGVPAPLADTGLALDVSAYDMALASGDLGTVAAPLGLLYIVGASGNQAYAFRLSVPQDQLQAAAVYGYFPLRSFGGKALAADATRAYYDFGDRFVPLAEQPRPRYVREATIVTTALDGREPDCVWHRLMVDACVPPETTVEVWSRAADDGMSLAAATWLPEPRPQRRREGSELPFVPPGPDSYGTFELLFQRSRGRYLQLRLRLGGDERTSPRLRALRAYYPRFSYLAEYLPKVYREDEESAAFLDRYLANPEGINTAIEDRIATAHVLFDPDAAPATNLGWLASWLDVALDAGWDEVKRRLFVRNAWKILRLRGTARGLTLALRLALEECVDEDAFDRREDAYGGPRIVERFRTRIVPAVALGDPTGVSAPRLVAVGSRWRPEHGGEVLHEHFRRLVAETRGEEEIDPSLAFTAAPPGEDLAAIWSRFSQAELGFVPVAGGEAAWRGFLRARYRRFDSLQGAHSLGADVTSFDDVPLPQALPPDGAALQDWYQFQAVVLPMHRAAHAFTVLLPVPAGESGSFDHEARRALATRIVSIQRPAHTVFDVRFYWSAFRVGEARLQLDTVIDLGSRSPALLSPLVLGREHLGESLLGGDPAPSLTQPPSIGRQTVLR
jgi:phage tail-like protein